MCDLVSRRVYIMVAVVLGNHAPPPICCLDCSHCNQCHCSSLCPRAVGADYSLVWAHGISNYGGGLRLFTHPFLPRGCTAGFRLPPRLDVDYVMISSRLLDEGFIDNLPPDTKVLAEAGLYNIGGTTFQGIASDHDRLGGRRFGRNVMWRWDQAGIRLLHMGGSGSSNGGTADFDRSP